MKVDIVNFETTKAVLLEHLDAPEKVLETAGKFIAWRKETGLSPVNTSKTFGIPYNDPNTTEPYKFRWDMCRSIEDDVPENKYGVESGVISGGRCAVIRLKEAMIAWMIASTMCIVSGCPKVVKKYGIIPVSFTI